MTTNIASPEHLQLQSPLLRLPAEIKHIIYGLCFVSDNPIVDPQRDFSRDRESKETGSSLGVALLQTCRRAYHEADHRPLFAQNRFRFTTVDAMRNFLHSLGATYGPCVQDIEVDVRKVHSDHPGVAREWLDYLAWGKGPWAETLGSLRMDAVGLKCLRLNFESWPVVPLFRTELWNLLRNMLSKLEGFERVIVVGTSKGWGMSQRPAWSPVHFVGGDDVGSDDLIPRMWSVVKGSDDDKIIRWTRADGKLQLEVVSQRYLRRCVDTLWTGPSKRSTQKWPANGSCTYLDYKNRDSEVTEPTTKGLNPSAAG